MFTLWLALTAGTAHAQDCDAKQLTQDIADASPVAVPRVYLKLAECDEAAALKAAPDAMAKVLHGDEGNQAALAALRVGAQQTIMDWVDNLEPDHRAQTILWLGDQCAEVPAIGDFFVDSYRGEKHEAFLSERWYRGMSKCRVSNVQELIREMVENPDKAPNRQQMFGFIEVYARNLGVDAVPHLQKVVSEIDDAKEASLILNAFADAANVGSVEGMNMDAAKASIAAIEQLGPNLPPESAEQARLTLIALGDEDKADGFAIYRWPERLVDGSYRYAVSATETVTCKNGKSQVWWTHGMFTEPGSQWPDSLEMDVEETAKGAWDLNRAAKCKGNGKVRVVMTEEPVADDAAYDTFVEAQRAAYDTAAKDAWKAEEFAEEPRAF